MEDSSRSAQTSTPGADDSELLARLRAGDEAAFIEMIGRYGPSLRRLARSMVASEGVAEEVVQETWLGVMKGVHRFEGRSSFKTWLMRILANQARSAGTKERRAAPGPAVDPDRFDDSGSWREPLVHWADDVDNRLAAASASGALKAALASLSDMQRQVIVLRDVEGLDSDEVCEILAISATNQRVLLHRGRNRLRQALEDTMIGY